MSEERPIPIMIRDALMYVLQEHVAPKYGMHVFYATPFELTDEDVPAVVVYVGDGFFDTEPAHSGGQVVTHQFGIEIKGVLDGDAPDIDAYTWGVWRDIKEAIGDGTEINNAFGVGIIEDLTLSTASRADNEPDTVHVSQQIVYEAKYTLPYDSGAELG